MATIKPTRAFAKKCFDSFWGLGSQRSLMGEGASEMCNLRIMPDGTLTSREGYRTIAHFPNQRIRGVWEGVLNHETHRFAAAGSNVYLLDTDTGIHTHVATISQSDTSVEFIRFEERLYLLDGENLRVYQPSSRSFITAEPYVPLVGYQWHPTDFGNPYEPLNLLTPRMRVRYLNSISSTIFYLPFYAKSVDAVYVNGTRTSKVTLCDGGAYIDVPSAEGASQVDVVMTADFSEDSAIPVRQARHALVHMIANKEHLLLYGTDDSCTVYPSAHVSTEMLRLCNVLIPSALPLYFKESDVLFLGSTEHPARALCPYNDGILAFGDTEIWRLYTKNNVTLEAESIVSGIGCPSHGMALLCDNHPLTVDTAGLMKIDSPLSRPELLNTQHIPYPVLHPPLTVSKNSITVWLPAERELWIRDPEDQAGKVLIYQADSKQWYCFDNIAATVFFRFSDTLGFGTEDGKLCLFDSTCTTDDASPFHCRYQSTYFDFGTPEAVRRSLRLSVCANLHGGEATVTLTDEHRASVHILNGKKEHLPEHFELRRKNGRYRFLRFAIDARSDCKVELYKLSFFTNP